MALLIAQNIAAVRGGRALWPEHERGLSFALESGAALRVTGANGSGKSTFLQICAGLLTPAFGTLDCAQPRAYLGHENALKADRTVAQELAFWGVSEAAGAVADFGMRGLADVPVGMLSAGQRRRVALWRTCAGGAPIWLLDEPEVGLDRDNRHRLAAVIAGHREAGGVVVIASHGAIDMPGAQELAL